MPDDPQSRFYDLYEKYLSAKRRNEEEKEIGTYALLSLVQIHLIVGSSDQVKAATVMHELMGHVLPEAQTKQMYDELRKDSGVGEGPAVEETAQRVGFA
jgi:hypothetical protein